MAKVMAVAFTPLGRLYYLDPGELEVAFGQAVLVPTGEGNEIAHCVWGPVELEWPSPLPACAGLAQPEDLERDLANRLRRAEIDATARRLIAAHQLNMKVVGVDYVDQSDRFDRQAVIYFEAPGRVDFRALISDLARSLKARIDLRQVGPRDAAAIIGGAGVCGRELCCASMGLPSMPVTTKLARAKDVAQPASQLLGCCGRLMCCLAFEDGACIGCPKK